MLEDRLAVARGRARRADGRPRPRRAPHRRERHRQERVRPRPDRPRPPPGRRRHGRGPPPGRDGRSSAPARPPRATTWRSAASASSTCGICSASPRRAPRSGSSSSSQLERWDTARNYDRLGLDDVHHELLGLRVPQGDDAGGAGPQPWRPWSKWRPATSCCAPGAPMRPATSSRASTSGWPVQASGLDDGRGRRRARRRRRGMSRRATKLTARPARADFLVLTGLSGAGKSQAIHALEDLGYFCVDNLPVALLPELLRPRMRRDEALARVAVVVDVRERRFLDGLSRGLRPPARHRRRAAGAHLPRGEPRPCCCGASARRGGRIRWRPTSRSPRASPDERRRWRASGPWPTRSSTPRDLTCTSCGRCSSACRAIAGSARRSCSRS